MENESGAKNASKATGKAKTPAKSKAVPVVIDLHSIDPKSLTIVQGLREKQLAIVKENPFVAIVDSKTYEAAKKSRNALLSASTSVEKEDKNLASFLSKFRKSLGETLMDCANLTRSKYDIQQAEVARHEKVLEDQKAERDRIAKEREDAIKNQIDELEKTYKAKLESMTYETRENDEQEIYQSIENHSGTFEEFDVFFDMAASRTKEALQSRLEEVVFDYKQAETVRKEKIEREIKDREVAVKEVIFSMTFQTMGLEYVKIKSTLAKPYDFQEYDEEYKSITADLDKKYNDRKTELENAENDRVRQQEEAEELNLLRLEKKYNTRTAQLMAAGLEKVSADSDEGISDDFIGFGVTLRGEDIFAADESDFDEMLDMISRGKNYTERSAFLDTFGLVKLQNGDMSIDSVTYTRDHIENDTDEEFKATIENIQNRSITPPVTPEIAEETNDFAAEISDQPVSNFEKAIDNAASENLPQDAAAPINEPIAIGVPKTIGHLRKMIAQFSDDTVFRNDYELTSLCNGYGEKVVYFVG